MYPTTALTALLLLLTVSASPHGIRKVHRRHPGRSVSPPENIAARRDAGDFTIPAPRRRVVKRSTCKAKQSAALAPSAASASASASASESAAPVAAAQAGTAYAVTPDSDTNCTTNGAWQCVGQALQRCNFETWVHIQTCTGDNVVCSADDRATGCIWTWSLPTNASDINGTNDTTPVTATPIPSNATASALPTQAIGSTSNIIASVSATTTAASVSSASVTTAPSSSVAVIGGNLYAGDGGDSDTSSSSSSSHKHHKSSSTNDWYGATSSSDDSYETVASTTAWSASSTDAWTASSTDVSSSSSSQDWYGHSHKSASAYDSATTTSTDWGADPTSSATWSESSSTKGGKGSASYSATGSAASAVATTVTSAPSGSYNAPHYVIYADEWLTRMPDPSQLTSYNRFILAFWMAKDGAVDNAVAWEWFTEDYRQQVLDAYHQAGIALMVSAFGSTDSPTSDGMDPTDVATRLANWVKQYGLDGVDIDYEDMPAMNNDKAEAWIITFQQSLRSQLPSPYIISHAPVAPWFTSGPDYPSGAYVKIHEETGSGIDFYNVQFYNQGVGVYEDCDSLLTSMGGSWPSTSVAGINSYAKVPLDKIVIGKPADSGAADNGYMSASALAKCVAQAEQTGWNGGVMFWEWEESIAPSLMATVRGG